VGAAGGSMHKFMSMYLQAHGIDPEKDVKLVHFSTDYVFDGNSNVPYKETSETNPQTSYGKSKLEGEKAALIHNATMIIRTSWLYSSFGSNFVKTILNKAPQWILRNSYVVIWLHR
jgi:dTDP-4-dehydrorhamnose reductase